MCFYGRVNPCLPLLERILTDCFHPVLDAGVKISTLRVLCRPMV